MAMVQALDEQKRRDENYLGDLKVCGGGGPL
jgi:hypothetical protein